MTRLIVSSQTVPLNGTISVPGDKSISHRAVILAALAEGISEIKDWLPAGDTLATLQIMRALGVEIDIKANTEQSWDLTVRGRGLTGLREPGAALNCQNAGTCMRLMAGVLAGQKFPTVLDGSEQLRNRPMRRIIDPLTKMGARIDSAEGKAPLSIQPAILKGISYRLPLASAQVKSAVLLAGLSAAGSTSVRQPGPARDHTEKMLANMGAPIEEEGRWVHLRRGAKTEGRHSSGHAGKPMRLQPLVIEVPGDVSSAAFPIVAAVLTPGSQISLAGVGCNETRTGLLDVLSKMNAVIEVHDIIFSGGEPSAMMTIGAAALRRCSLSGDDVVRAIDEIPVWAVAATQAHGTSRLRDAAELRVKEVDRLHLLAAELGKMGAQINERTDGLDIHGPVKLIGAEVESHGDHRLAMALTIAGLVADGKTAILSAGAINDSFPGFVETMRSLGAELSWL